MHKRGAEEEPQTVANATTLGGILLKRFSKPDDLPAVAP
jgi:hypothetical protein